MPPPPPAAAAASAVKEDELDNKRKRVYFTEAAFSFPNKADAYGAPASFSGGESPKNKPKLEWNSRPALFTLTAISRQRINYHIVQHQADDVDMLFECYSRVSRIINDTTLRIDFALDAPPGETQALAYFFKAGAGPIPALVPGVLMRLAGRFKNDYFHVFCIRDIEDDPSEQLACATMRAQLSNKNKEA